MAILTSDGFAHVRLTVTDIQKSKTFYDTLFGWPVAADESADVDDPQVRADPARLYGGVVYQTPQGTLFGLRPVGDAAFDPDHVGLDHVSFAVADRAALQTAKDDLDSAGIRHGDIIELTDMGAAILSVQDPDDINIELTAPL